jgi:hypothetical protein
LINGESIVLVQNDEREEVGSIVEIVMIVLEVGIFECSMIVSKILFLEEASIEWNEMKFHDGNFERLWFTN